MTDLDILVIEGIKGYWAENANAPTLRELMIRIKQPSFKNVHASLTRLRAAGIVHWNERRSRTLRVVTDASAEQFASVAKDDAGA